MRKQFATVRTTFSLFIVAGLLNACNSTASKTADGDSTKTDTGRKVKYLSQPLISTIYTADPSAHVFNGKIYIYPSHDIDAGVPENDNGDHFAMKDYHILSMDSIGGKVTDNGVGLDKKDVFHIGVAVSASPVGPFKAEPESIAGSYSIDPAVFSDTDGKTYMYFGGIWGGQLQRWISGKYEADGSKTDSKQEDAPAISCKVALLSADMKHFDGAVKDAVIVDSLGKPLLTKDHDRRFFEGSWMHKYNGKYYFTYSTGDTHLLCYAIGDSPLGPFTYKGVFMTPVEGWTTHHSIIEIKGKWYLFYHDTQLSGKTHLRNVKVTELQHNADGTIALIRPNS